MNLFRYRKKSTTKCREIHFIKAETGQQSPRQRPDGDRRSDDGKPRDSVSDTVGNMAAGGLAKRFTVGQQVFNMKTSKKYNETIKEQQEEIDHLKTEIEEMEKDCKELIEQVNQYAAANTEKNEKIAKMASSEETIRLQTERDTYKTMYEQLLNRLVNGGAA